MECILLSEQDRAEYTDFIEGQPGCSFLQSWEWGMWQEQQGRKILRIAITDAEEQWLTAMTLVIQTVPLFRFEYLYIPYGPVIHSGDSVIQEKMLCTLVEWVKKKYPQVITIRVEAIQGLSFGTLPIQKSTHIQPGSTLVVDLSKDEAMILDAMHHKTRYNIKVASKHGVEITHSTKPDEEDLRLITTTAQRQQYRTYSTNYYQNLLNYFNTSDSKLKAQCYTASYNHSVIAVGIMIDYRDSRTYLFGGSSDAFRNVMGPYLLHWQAMKDAKSQGMTSYDFWGAETARGKSVGFVKFKQGFGGQLTTYPDTWDIVLRSLPYAAYRFMRLIYRMTT